MIRNGRCILTEDAIAYPQVLVYDTDEDYELFEIGMSIDTQNDLFIPALEGSIVVKTGRMRKSIYNYQFFSVRFPTGAELLSYEQGIGV